MKNNTIAVVHGESERILVKDLSRRMRYPIEVYPLKSDRTVDLPNIAEVLSSGPFLNDRSLHKQFPRLEYESRKPDRFPGLAIMPIIDVDQHDQFRKQYLSKSMFQNSRFKDNIIPILNNPDLDIILNNAGINVDKHNKVRSYSEKLNGIDYCQLYEMLKDDPNTNLELLILRALGCSPPYQDKYRKEYELQFRSN